MWTTMKRLQLRIGYFTSKTLTYNTGGTPPQSDEASDGEEELDDDGNALEPSNDTIDQKFGFQADPTDTAASTSSCKCSYASVTACPENIKKSIKGKRYIMEGRQKPKHNEKAQWQRPKGR